MNTEAVSQQKVTLGGAQFTVEGDPVNGMVWLHGSRGAVYFLRPYIERDGDSGVRQVISWKSGQPLRVRGNEIRVLHLGNVIEQSR